jgi:regulator of cell morphogenesis and NO signaling
MQNFATKTIRDIALENPAATRVFEEYKIDYCCGGGRKFGDACRTAGVAPEVVSHKIDQLFIPEEFVSPASMGLVELIDHILEKHHVFTKLEIARLSPLMEKVRAKHGPQHAQLYGLAIAFTELSDDLTPHMEKEEKVLFPFVRQLVMSDANKVSIPRPPFRTVKNPVQLLMVEHDRDGQILKKMRDISGDYVLPEDACPSFGALYHGLVELERDLHRHIHLENNVLFPAAVKLEQKVMLDCA